MAKYEFIRHPQQIPLLLTPIAPPANTEPETERGLRLRYRQPFAPGQWLAVTPQFTGIEREFWGRVMWCKEVEEGYEMAIAFACRQAAFVARMLEQCCQIESYRNEQQRALRSLSMEQAAAEWITRHAAEFPE